MAVPVSGGDRGVVAADDPIGGLKEKVLLCAHTNALLSSCISCSERAAKVTCCPTDTVHL